MKYQWKDSARIKVDAQKVGELFERLESSVGLTAQSLLNESKNAGSLLHDEFEWDDGIAAENYRLEQARYIIRHLCVSVETMSSEPVRAYFAVAESKYENLSVIIKSQEKTDVLLQQACNELLAFKRKYASIQKLVPIFDAIDIFTTQIKGD